MKKFTIALALAVAGISAHASVITAYESSTSFPYALATNNLLFTSFTTTGSLNGGNGAGVNVIYTFGADTEYVWFTLTPTQAPTLVADVTSADHTVKRFDRVASESMFWGFAAGNDNISSVRFSTTSSPDNSNVNNDKLTVNAISGYVQPTAPSAEVPEPGMVALFGLGLLSFAASRRKAGKVKRV